MIFFEPDREIIKITCKVQIKSHLFINTSRQQGNGAVQCAAI